MSAADGARSATALRQMWESGRRGEALRAALDAWQPLLAQDDDLQWLERACRDSGLPVEAFALQARAARRQGASAPSAWEALIGSLLRSGDAWWAGDLAAEVGGDARALRGLKIEAELELGDASASITAWQCDYRDEAAVDQALDWWVRNGCVEQAERLLEQVAGSTLWRARLALWRRQPAVARSLLRDLPRTPELACLEAIAAVQEGDLEVAESLLRALLDGEQRAEAWSWLATLLRMQRRYAEAIRAADAARACSTQFNLVPPLEREVADAYQRVGAGSAPPAWLGGLRQAIGLWLRPIRKLEHAAALYALGLRPRDSVRRIEGVLAAFGGNHTPFLTTVQQGRLVSCHLPVDARHLGSCIQRVLRTRGADAVRALFDAYLPRLAGHPLIRTYQGEIELWMGAYEDAARAFHAAIAKDRRTRWAWIGLGASTMLQGDLMRAQKIWRQGLSFTSRLTGVVGPSLHVYRGECYRRQGQRERARRDLDTALRQKPQRLSTRINLALLDEDPTVLAQVEADCVAVAPFLMETLSGSPAERLEQTLTAMRGNRSSSLPYVSYQLWGRLWHGVTPSRREP